jgi:imidazolonepropionase-like amidohydrolase
MAAQLSRRAVLRAGAVALIPVTSAGAVACTDPDDTPDVATLTPPPAATSFVVRGARVFDGERVIDADSVYVAGGTIAAVGRDLRVPDGVTVHDGAGRTLLPGLIDAHVHTSPETAREGPRFGVTSMLDMFTLQSLLPQFQRVRASRDNADAADVWTAGTMITAPGGHGTQYGEKIPTLDPGADPVAFVRARLDEGSDFIKITYEDGAAFGRQTPALTADQITAAVAAAHAASATVAIHVSTAAGAAIAVEAGADLLAHVPSDPLDGAVIEAMRERGTAVIGTLVVIAAGTCTDDAATLAADPRIAPYLTADQLALLARPFSRCSPSHLGNAQANIRALRAAGVPVLAGSDAGNPGTCYGASLHGELDLLVRSGLTPVQALTGATSLPAERFGLDDRGRVAEGRLADLLLVNGDPTAEITATRDIVTVWKNGHQVVRTPA